MTIETLEIGRRLRAYRMGVGLSVDEVADRLNLSRAAVYRFEKEGINKIETLERVARLMGVTVASLLGVSVEYNANAVAFFERLRQIEETSDWLFVAFGPAYLLTGDAWDDALQDCLLTELGCAEETRRLLGVLKRRKEAFHRRKPSLTNVVTAADIEHLARFGVAPEIGSAADDRRWRAAALEELHRLADMLERPPMHVQIGVLFDRLPSTSFSLARAAKARTLTISPFRLGARPSLRNGVSMITQAPDALDLHENVARDLWRRAESGQRAARFVRDCIATSSQPVSPLLHESRTF